jgi:hypothetical protein
VRALLFTLTLANLLFFGWSYWIDTPVPGRIPSAKVPPLELAPPLGATPSGSALPGAPSPPAAAQNSTAAAPPVSAATATLRCASLGPLTDPAGVAAVNTALQARNFTPRERQVQGEVADGYWVYIDNLRDAELRSRALKRLARAGVRDAAALASSGQVSVGLFSEKAGADLRAAAVRSAGFEPVIEARTRTVKEYWFDVQIPNDVPLPAVSALVAGLNVPALPAWRACTETVAGANP